MKCCKSDSSKVTYSEEGSQNASPMLGIFLNDLGSSTFKKNHLNAFSVNTKMMIKMMQMKKIVITTGKMMKIMMKLSMTLKKMVVMEIQTKTFS